jgi:hypothetical protein
LSEVSRSPPRALRVSTGTDSALNDNNKRKLQSSSLLLLGGAVPALVSQLGPRLRAHHLNMILLLSAKPALTAFDWWNDPRPACVWQHIDILRINYLPMPYPPPPAGLLQNTSSRRRTLQL